MYTCVNKVLEVRRILHTSLNGEIEFSIFKGREFENWLAD